MCSSEDIYSMTFQNSIGVPIKITEKVILDLIKTKEVQRLKHIKQAGITAYSKVYRGDFSSIKNYLFNKLYE